MLNSLEKLEEIQAGIKVRRSQLDSNPATSCQALPTCMNDVSQIMLLAPQSSDSPACSTVTQLAVTPKGHWLVFIYASGNADTDVC